MNETYSVWRNAFLGAIALSTWLVCYVLVGAPTREAQRYGMRGLKRERALANGGLFAQIEPLVRWCGLRISGLLSEGMRTGLDKQLRVAGDYLGFTSEEYAGALLLGAVAGGGVGFALGIATGNVPFLFMICVPFGAAIPYLLVSEEGHRRMQKIARRLPHAIDLMTLSMSAGADFPGAIRQLVEKASERSEPVIEEFSHLLNGLQLGRTRKQALLELAQRAPIDPVRGFVSACVQAEDRGNPVAHVLAIQAEALRRSRTAHVEQAAARAGVAMAGPLFLLFGAIMILMAAPMILRLRKGGV